MRKKIDSRSSYDAAGSGGCESSNLKQSEINGTSSRTSTDRRSAHRLVVVHPLSHGGHG
jgi:hypothetical protein